MALITWKFVDQPIAVPTTAFDMNNGATTRVVDKDGPQMPAPPLRRSIAQNAMTDGGMLTSAAYDLRELAFTVWLNGVDLSARITQLDALKRELAKPANLLMFVPPGGSNPVFFQTIRSDEYLPDYAGAAAANWRIKCSVLAQPFAIGIRHDVTTGAVVTNDPASGTNKTLIDITGVRGDSPAPAFARVALGSGTAPTFFWAQRSAGNPTSLTLFAQAEAGTMGTDTTVQANDTAMSGAGSNYVKTTFTTATLTTRLTVTVPTGSDATALKGRYRVLAKIRMSASGSNFTMRFVQNPSGTNTVTGQQVSFDTSAAIAIVDLGVIDFPAVGAVPATIGYSGLAAGVATQTMAIQAGRNTGTATLDTDYIYLLPADERSSQFRRANWAASSFLCIDGPQEIAYGMAAGTTAFGSTRTVDNAGGLSSYVGGFPMLVPGVTNRWYTLIGPQPATATSTWDVSYWPRWREVATS
jgi:hypothetical protein